jgi:hypothetical protein
VSAVGVVGAWGGVWWAAPASAGHGGGTGEQKGGALPPLLAPPPPPPPRRRAEQGTTHWRGGEELADLAAFWLTSCELWRTRRWGDERRSTGQAILQKNGPATCFLGAKLRPVQRPAEAWLRPKLMKPNNPMLAPAGLSKGWPGNQTGPRFNWSVASQLVGQYNCPAYLHCLCKVIKNAILNLLFAIGEVNIIQCKVFPTF